MKRNIIIISLTLLSLIVIGFTLKGNKAAIQEEIKDSQRTHEYIPVQTQKSAIQKLKSSIHSNGRLLPYAELNILSEVNGKIVKINKEKGARVHKNETLAIIDPEVYQAKYESEKAKYEKLSKDLVRYEKLAKSEAITKNELEKAKLSFTQAKSQMIIAQKNLNNTAIKSPMAGVVNDDFLEIGELINNGKKLYELVNTNKLKINTSVGESEVMSIKQGTKAQITTNIYPKNTFEATVNAVAEKADQYYRYNVELVFDNPKDFPLKGGMYAEIEFPEIERNCIIINRNAMKGSLKNATVFIVENDIVSPRSITVGYANDDIVEVLSGLEVGENIVTSGLINLEEGTKVKVIN